MIPYTQATTPGILDALVYILQKNRTNGIHIYKDIY